MPYPITLSDGVTSLITVPDNTILGPLSLNAPSNCSLNLVGRGSVSFGQATATNFVWLLQNFASSTAPVSPLQGQIWYNTVAGAPTLRLLNTSNQWVQIATSDAPFSSKGDFTVQDGAGDSATLGANGVITLIRADYKPRVVFEGTANSSNAATLQLGVDQFGQPDLTIYSPAFSTNKVGAIWHSENLTPISLGGNNIITGNNTFTGYNIFTVPTHFSEILVDNSNDSALVDITPGSIVLKNTQANCCPLLTFESPNPSSTNVLREYFADPNFYFEFATGSSMTPTGYISFNPTPTLYDNNLIHTAYHTGNLAPILQVAANQTITGNLTLVGSSNLTVGGSETVNGNLTVNGTGAFAGLLTAAGGNRVLTVADEYSLPYLPIGGGTISANIPSIYFNAAGNPNLGWIGADANQIYIGKASRGTTSGGGDGIVEINISGTTSEMGIFTDTVVYGDLSVWTGDSPINTTSAVSILQNGDILCANVYASGGVYSNDVLLTSDERLKSNIVSYTNALSTVNSLDGKRFTKNWTGELALGLIAQEVLPFIPEVVKKNPITDMYGIDYSSLVGVLVNAVKELSNQVAELQVLANITPIANSTLN